MLLRRLIQQQILHKRLLQIRRLILRYQFRRCADGQHPSLVHEGDAVAARRFVHEVGRYKNGDFVFARHPQQVPPEHIPRRRVNARCGFVQYQYFRAVQAGGGQLQPLADAQRQRGGFDVGDVCQVKLRQGITNRRLAARAEAVKAGVQGEVLPHGELFVERERLRHIADAHPRRHAARIDRRAEQFRRAAGRLQEAGEHFHRRRFAAAVAAEEAEDFALLDGEADVINRGEIAEALGETVRLNRGRQPRVGDKGRQIQPARALLFFRRQQADVGVFEVGVSGHHLARRRVHQQFARVHRP